ncbi:MAG TPA: hypothetical protein VHM65_06435 [Candidatus Lustribacter sp.]|nr:hypothetical protein [Candidatus Lustribacter sp.]
MNRSSTRALLVGAVAALGLGLTLSACSVVDKAHAAAVVDGRVIEESAVDASVAQLRSVEVTVGPGVVLGMLILAKPVADQVSASGSWKPDAAYNAFLARIPDPTPATVEVVRTNSALSALTADDQKAVLAALRSMTVTVNPRYGSFNASTGQIAPLLPAWIRKPATPVPGS